MWLFLIPAGLAFILLGLFLEEVGFFLRHIPSSDESSSTCVCPDLLIALYVPRSSSLCNFIASLYHSTTLLKFMGLITDFFGGKVRMLAALSGHQVSPDPFPCCCCCCLPMVAITDQQYSDWSLISSTVLGPGSAVQCLVLDQQYSDWSWISSTYSDWPWISSTVTVSLCSSSRAWMMAAVLQLSVVRSILFFVTLVLWTDEQYDYGDVDSVNPNVYVNGIICVSTFVSFYGHLLFYKATNSALHGYGLRAKFICIIVVLVLCGLQSGILETMVIYHYCVIVEMFCIGLWKRLFKQTTFTRCFTSRAASSALSNPSYSSDNEDSLCRIEHAPLDGFPFPKARGQQPGRPEPGEPSGSHAQEEYSILFLVGDLPTYKTIVQLKAENPEMYKDIIPILGAFHQQMSYIYAIYKRFKDLAWQTLWSQQG
ncbi:hypothetical protein F7725_000115 [Dissostichus mawsoni]|uniref:Uncharacterized protein n=1 Tax=Dissostichus mawsoni TaxID=36200 RepID=A0A7J5ZE42_DISMA|nr:hypothetical protein F7725_000115 [Dissostichus mawsoni]